MANNPKKTLETTSTKTDSSSKGRDPKHSQYVPPKIEKLLAMEFFY